MNIQFCIPLNNLLNRCVSIAIRLTLLLLLSTSLANGQGAKSGAGAGQAATEGTPSPGGPACQLKNGKAGNFDPPTVSTVDENSKVIDGTVEQGKQGLVFFCFTTFDATLAPPNVPSPVSVGGGGTFSAPVADLHNVQTIQAVLVVVSNTGEAEYSQPS